MSEVWAGIDAQPALLRGEVQVWTVRLPCAGPGVAPQSIGLAYLEPLARLLSLNERTRAARMRPGLPREEFIAGRGYLRLLLGALLERAPESLAIVAGPDGKPGLAPGASGTSQGDRICFNVAHSRGLILIALSRAGAVGVDVEWINPAVEMLDIAGSSMHPLEIERIRSAPAGARRERAFFRCWTRKEAVVKADGRGLSLPLTGFSVVREAVPDCGPECDPEELTEQRVALDDSRTTYLVRDLAVISGYAAALALTREHVPVRFLEAHLPAWAGLTDGREGASGHDGMRGLSKSRCVTYR